MTEASEGKLPICPVQSCSLGRIGNEGIALQINFSRGESELSEGSGEVMFFALPRELAGNLAQALSATLAEMEASGGS
jgi:hypothetical protein